MPRGGGRSGDDTGRGLLTDTAHVAQFDANLMSQYGMHANAEDMILSHQRSYSPALRRANLSQVDGGATEELKADSDWQKAVAKKLGLADTDRVLDVAVRGNALVAIVENELGWPRKEVGPANDDYDFEFSPDEEVAQAEVSRERALAEQTRLLRAEAEMQLAEVRAEIEAEMQAQLAKIREAGDKEVAKAQADVEKAADSTKKRPAARRSTSSRRPRPRSASRKSGSVKGGTAPSGTGEQAAPADEGADDK